MRELAAVGIVALAFGLGAFYADRDVPLFAVAVLFTWLVLARVSSRVDALQPREGGSGEPRDETRSSDE